LETLWQKMLLSLYHVHRDSILRPSRVSQQRILQTVDRMQKLLCDSSALLPSENDTKLLQLSMTTERICQRVISLAVYLQFFLDSFLFRSIPSTKDVEPSESLRVTIRDILQRTSNLIYHISNIRDYINQARSIPPSFDPRAPKNKFLRFEDVCARGLKSDPKERDTALALLYSFCQLLLGLLQCNADVNEYHNGGIIYWAITMCRLCASFPKSCYSKRLVNTIMKKSLFWAGLILTRLTYPEGNRPSSQSNRSARMDKGKNVGMYSIG
jgi:hypothetical protein